MGKIIRTRRDRRDLQRRLFVAAVASFVAINVYILLRPTATASGVLEHLPTQAGEGAHRYRQTELASIDEAAAAAEEAVAAVAASGTAGGAAAPKCNVWVWCGQYSGCTGNRVHRECWLKRADNLNPAAPQGGRSAGSGWVSGAIYTKAEKDAALAKKAAADKAEADYLEGLKRNDSLPLVYLDVEIKQRKAGRIEMVLFTDVSPRSAENFRQLCTGESGTVPNEPGREGAGRKRHFKGAYFYRIIDQFIDQTGVETESVFGGQFKDDPGGLQLKHDRKGLLSMANMGPNTNTAHFSIMIGPAPHLNGHYTIFGQVVSGFDVVDAINALSKGKPDNTATAADGAQIVDSGQLRKGTIVPDLKAGL
ncbi:Peptidyl-prolyl cis-trans isomerase D [Chlorella sorokiniana]|uniref:Peptidyl-prolyl cis-trans isomerase D n=1 Tax=Chlorella sorokiniana TaxID=3076 RepID=A0A2P6TMK3_CHLSO|nr:Peptidyl-prolyl cis-trans isomerase D [Chlorella sorokiniana]|eukprot:PRW45561.1 Peptidyl-prolyl cis-trans isomerase D [Chlorella sorokiniana]